MLTAHKTQEFLLCMVRCYILAKIFWYIPRVDAWTLNNCVCVWVCHCICLQLYWMRKKKRNSTKFCYTNVAWKWNIHKQNGIKTNRREEQKTHVSEWETYEIECCKYLLGWIFSATSSSSLSSSSFSASWFSFAFIEDSLCLTESCTFKNKFVNTQFENTRTRSHRNITKWVRTKAIVIDGPWGDRENEYKANRKRSRKKRHTQKNAHGKARKKDQI